MKHVLRLTLLLAVVVLAFAAQPALAQVVGSMHDLGSGGAGSFTATNTDRVCVFCHTPHQAAAANSQDPLWNHTLSGQASYGVYGSTTMNAVPTDIGGAVAGSAAVSNLCMSCHDGTVGVGSLYKDPTTGAPDNSGTTISGSALVGTTLTDDHPVNFTYDAALATADGELVTPNSATSVDAAGNIPLFVGASVQCASCHDPHDTTNTPFLVVSNANSALCTSCHQK
jgi:predicted CXXCH cytochrome family protein